MTKQQLVQISNLLFTGKWNLSAQESNQVIQPLINDMAKEIEALEKTKAK